MNLVDVEADVKAIAHLDFDLTCEVRVQHVIDILGMLIPAGVSTPECPSGAVGYLICKRCSITVRTCEAHRAHTLARKFIMCIPCKHEGPGADVFRFEPLKVRS